MIAAAITTALAAIAITALAAWMRRRRQRRLRAAALELLDSQTALREYLEMLHREQ